MPYFVLSLFIRFCYCLSAFVRWSLLCLPSLMCHSERRHIFFPHSLMCHPERRHIFFRTPLCVILSGGIFYCHIPLLCHSERHILSQHSLMCVILSENISHAPCHIRDTIKSNDTLKRTSRPNLPNLDFFVL